MSDEPQYKMVDGVMVQLTPEEIAANQAAAAQEKQRETLVSSNKNLDMGKTMFEILNG